jgi:ABC-2 type transport system permease protein
MFTDIVTIIHKEWKEIFIQRGSARSGWASVLVILGVVGVLMPLQSGREWLENPLLTVVWSWLPIFLTIHMVTDAIAGERERHTLETLLASRLSDLAIILGKLGAAVLYGWGIAAASMLAGAVTVNLTAGGGGLLFYPLWSFAGGLALALLASIFMAGLGVLVSLGAPTARAAYQRLSLAVMALWLLPTLGVQFLPKEILPSLGTWMMNVPWPAVLLGAVGLLLVADVAVVAVVLARFRRSRLVFA